MSNYLQAMATAYDQAIEDAGVAVSHNPYQKLLDDRATFVRKAVDDGFGSILDQDGDDVLGGDVLDTILDAHNDWLLTHGGARTSAPDEAVDLRREALRIALDAAAKSTSQWDSHLVVNHAAAIAAYLRDGTVPTDEDELAEALYVVASHLHQREVDNPGGQLAYTAAELRDLAKELDQ